jgi:hypothetical protein
MGPGFQIDLAELPLVAGGWCEGLFSPEIGKRYD